MNYRRRIGYASKPLCGGAYRGQGRMGTGCVSPGANFLRSFLQRGRLLVMLWTGAPGDRQEVDGGSPSR